MMGAGRGEAEAHFAFISGAGRQCQQGQSAGVLVPLAPDAQNCISLWSLGPAGAMCAQAADNFARLVGFGRGGQGIKFFFSFFLLKEKKKNSYFKNNSAA